MGTVVAFPIERVDYFKTTDYSQSATVLSMPIVERRDERLLGEEGIRRRRAQLHGAARLHREVFDF